MTVVNGGGCLSSGSRRNPQVPVCVTDHKTTRDALSCSAAFPVPSMLHRAVMRLPKGSRGPTSTGFGQDGVICCPYSDQSS